MNNKGQTLMLSLLFAIFIFLAGIVFVNFLTDDVTTFRAAMNCSDAAGISDGAKLTCLFGDSVVPYWILLIVSLAGGTIFARLLV